MAKWIIAFILFGFGLFLLIQGTVIPLYKNKKCTYKVYGNVLSKEDKGFSADDGTTFNYTLARVRYLYRTKAYTTKVSMGINPYKSSIPLRINPDKPNMCILDNRKYLIITAIITTIASIGFMVLSVFWVIVVIYSLI